MMPTHDPTSSRQRQTLTVPSRLPASRMPAACGTVLQMALVIAARYSELPQRCMSSEAETTAPPSADANASA